jgi:chromosomal replication initiation ATPase DnaA
MEFGLPAASAYSAAANLSKGRPKGAGEEYDRRMGLHSAGIELSAVIDAVCWYVGIDQNELASPAKRAEIARARALIGHMATRDLPISGSEVARRLNIDRSAVSRAVYRVRPDAELTATARTIWGLLKPAMRQH